MDSGVFSPRAIIAFLLSTRYSALFRLLIRREIHNYRWITVF
jgi:hypothetical protein